MPALWVDQRTDSVTDLTLEALLELDDLRVPQIIKLTFGDLVVEAALEPQGCFERLRRRMDQKLAYELPGIGLKVHARQVSSVGISGVCAAEVDDRRSRLMDAHDRYGRGALRQVLPPQPVVEDDVLFVTDGEHDCVLALGGVDGADRFSDWCAFHGLLTAFLGLLGYCTARRSPFPSRLTTYDYSQASSLPG